jgi:OFA family oxalate/formate antiporter-like MFS transporter
MPQVRGVVRIAPPFPSRRGAALAASLVVMLAFGATHAWSVFSAPLAAHGGWGRTQVAAPYALSSLTLAAAFFGGLLLPRLGPRRTVALAGLMYGAGVGLTALAGDRLWWIYLSYGLLGGLGIGLGYVVPTAILAAWFPERRGAAIGVALAAFGAGAFVWAPAGAALVARLGVLPAFGVLGPLYGTLVVGAAPWLRPPPVGWRPPAAGPAPAAASAPADHTLRAALATPQWYGLWLLLFLTGFGGKALIAEAAPLAAELTGATPLAAARLVGTVSVANAAGRIAWGWASDRLGRRAVFFLMFLSQAAAFAALPAARSALAFCLCLTIVLSCFGGGTAALPALAADYFGARHVGQIYGLLISATALGGVAGALLIARVREATGDYAPALGGVAALLLAGTLVPPLLRPPAPRLLDDGSADHGPGLPGGARPPGEAGLAQPAG